VRLRSIACTIALDGERELDIAQQGHDLEVILNPTGPLVVDIAAALQAGAERGVFVESPPSQR